MKEREIEDLDRAIAVWSKVAKFALDFIAIVLFTGGALGLLFFGSGVVGQ